MQRSLMGLAFGGLVVLCGCDPAPDLDGLDGDTDGWDGNTDGLAADTDGLDADTDGWGGDTGGDTDGWDGDTDGEESDPEAICDFEKLGNTKHNDPTTEPIGVAIDDLANPLDPAAGVYEVGKPWPKHTVSVCFTSAPYLERGWIQNAVLASWEAVSGVDLEFQGTCSGPGSADISVAVLDSFGGRYSQLGTNSASAYPSMTLGVNFSPLSCGASTECTNEYAANGKTKRQNCIEGIAIHEFGHALGLRHEQDHPDSTCGTPTLDGEPLWSYDGSSVMNYCNQGTLLSDPKLSSGDVRTINSLYPGQVVAFSDPNWKGKSQRLGWGSWRACAGELSMVGGNDISSLVVPPGLRVKVCTDAQESYCRTYWTNTNFETSYDQPLRDNVGKIVVDAYVPVYDGPSFTGPTYQYLYPGTYRANESDLFWVGNDRISSMLVPPNTSARMCQHEGAGNGSGWCKTVVGGEPMSHILPGYLDNQVSFVQVRKRVATYDKAQYKGDVYSYDVGTYRVSNGTLKGGTTIASLSIPTGLQARVCTHEGTGNGGGTCATYTGSRNSLPATLDEIRFMQVGVPFFQPVQPACFNGTFK